MSDRAMLIRMRHRRLQRSQGAEQTQLSADEVRAVQKALLAGEPIASVAKRFGVKPRRVHGILMKVTPCLLDRAGIDRRWKKPEGPRLCAICGAEFEVQKSSSPQRTCGARCGGKLSRQTSQRATTTGEKPPKPARKSSSSGDQRDPDA